MADGVKIELDYIKVGQQVTVMVTRKQKIQENFNQSIRVHGA